MTCGVTGLGGELMTRTKDHNNHNQLSQLIVKPNQIVNPYFFGDTLYTYNLHGHGKSQIQNESEITQS